VPPTTLVTFPTHALKGAGVVLDVIEVEGAPAVIVDVTPFHPVDNAWPDQPTDTGWLETADGRTLTVTRCLTATYDGSYSVDHEIEHRRGAEGVEWLVVHVLEAGVDAPVVGSTVELVVDVAVRTPLSAGHTACHLAALALNAEAAAAGFWRKDGNRLDSLGNPDLDQLAIVTSAITPWGAVDSYRFGRTLRKSGLEVADLLAGVKDLEAAVNARLAQWCATGAPVSIDAPDANLTARRSWVVQLPDGTATINCGGTHPSTLADLTLVTVSYETQPDEPGLVARTSVEHA
jgi:alanyl-tRNA synthetase